MTYRYWPLFDLRLATPGLALRPMTEADLGALADLLPDDVEQDPAATAYDVGDARTGRGIISHQSYWTAYGTWRPSAWRLNFVVRVAGEIVGVQELEGNDFLTLRTVDSSSFLIPAARGQGNGKQMRSAVLALAFGPLQAEAAITSAWHDNHAPLGRYPRARETPSEAWLSCHAEVMAACACSGPKASASTAPRICLP